MLSQEAEQALALLAEGATLNSLHTTARELIEAGLAATGWGQYLELTETGRIHARRRASSFRNFEIESDYIHNLTTNEMANNPMGPSRAEQHEQLSAAIGLDSSGSILPPPPNLQINREPKAYWQTHTPASYTPATPPALPSSANYTPSSENEATKKGLHAAGIASGKTGEWPTSEWVQAFIDAWHRNSEPDTHE